MKVTTLSKTRILMAGILVLPVLIFGGMVFAQTDENDAQSETTPAQKKQQLEDRLAERKAAFKQRLSFVQQARLKARCQSAQGLLRSAEVRINGVATRRMNAYEKLITKLNELSAKLNDQGIDTAELDSQLGELQTQVDAFEEQITEYKQAVSDLNDMDCEADPDAFKASLEAARTARTEAVKASSAIHDHVLGTVKDTLKDIKAQLNQDNGNGEESDG